MPRPCSTLLALLAALALPAGLFGAGTAADWHWQRTPQATVIFQGKPERASQLAADLSMFRQQAARFLEIDDSRLPPLLVLVFKDTRTLAQYRAAPVPGTTAQAGVFYRLEGGRSLIAVADGWGDGETRRSIYHEATHWLLHSSVEHLPLWLDEGLAELLSTLEIRRRFVVIGRPPPGHLELLRYESPSGWKHCFGIQPDSPEYQESGRASLFYAQSWALAHWLLLGRPASQLDQISEIATASRQWADPHDGLLHGLSMTRLDMDQTLNAYARYGGWRTHRRKLEPEEREVPRAEVQSAPQHEVSLALGLMSEAEGLRDRAHSHYAHAAGQAPTDPRPRLALGRLHAQRRDWEEASAHYILALRLGAKEPENCLRAAAAYFANPRWSLPLPRIEEGSADAAFLRDALRPWVETQADAGAAAWFGQCLATASGLCEADRNLLDEAARKPSAPAELRFWLALADYRLGRRQSVDSTLAQMGPGEGLPSALQPALARLRSYLGWEQVLQLARQRASAGQADAAEEALASFEAGQPCYPPVEHRRKLRTEVVANARFTAALALLGSGKQEEALAIFTELDTSSTPRSVRDPARANRLLLMEERCVRRLLERWAGLQSAGRAAEMVAVLREARSGEAVEARAAERVERQVGEIARSYAQLEEARQQLHLGQRAEARALVDDVLARSRDPALTRAALALRADCPRH